MTTVFFLKQTKEALSFKIKRRKRPKLLILGFNFKSICCPTIQNFTALCLLLAGIHFFWPALIGFNSILYARVQSLRLCF